MACFLWNTFDNLVISIFYISGNPTLFQNYLLYQSKQKIIKKYSCNIFYYTHWMGNLTTTTNNNNCNLLSFITTNLWPILCQERPVENHWSILFYYIQFSYAPSFYYWLLKFKYCIFSCMCMCTHANAPVCAAPEQHLMNGNLVKLSLLQALK